MKFEKHFPGDRLREYIKYYVITENASENEYKVFPSSGLVIGFQYRGRLTIVHNQQERTLSTAGITGISGSYKTFRNSAGVGTVLVCFTETGFAHFASQPANELFNLSISLDEIFKKEKVSQTEEKLSAATSDKQRIKIVDQFLLSHLKHIQSDKLIVEAVKLIYQSKGTIQVKELNRKLFISQSPFEKRFRKVVGTTPGKFTSIVRFNAVLNDMTQPKSLTEICYENNFFDQSHFIKDFKQFTGETPEHFRRTR